MLICAEFAGTGEIWLLSCGDINAADAVVLAGWCHPWHGELPTLHIQSIVQLLKICAWPWDCNLPQRATAPPSAPNQQLKGIHDAPWEQWFALHRALLPTRNWWVVLEILHYMLKLTLTH
jgi:hypothetical protein